MSNQINLNGVKSSFSLPLQIITAVLLLMQIFFFGIVLYLCRSFQISLETITSIKLGHDVQHHDDDDKTDQRQQGLEGVSGQEGAEPGLLIVSGLCLFHILRLLKPFWQSGLLR